MGCATLFSMPALRMEANSRSARRVMLLRSRVERSHTEQQTGGSESFGPTPQIDSRRQGRASGALRNANVPSGKAAGRHRRDLAPSKVSRRRSIEGVSAANVSLLHSV